MSKKRVAIAAIITMLGFSSTAWSDSAKLVNPSGGHFYQRIDAEENWNNAKTSCANLGAYLATITSQSENDWIQETLSTGNQILIGGTDAAIEGTWTWITGETWSYTNWNYGEPNNADNEESLEILSTGKWNDIPNDITRPYLCEWNGPWLPLTSSDTCWRHTPSKSLIRVRFIAVGTGYYQFAGKMVESTGLINPIFGSAVVTATKLLGTSTHSGADPSNYWGEISNWSINRQTKALTAKAIGMEKIDTEPYYINLTLGLVACP